MQGKGHYILAERLKKRLGSHLTGSSQEKVELRLEPIKRRSVDYGDLFFKALPWVNFRFQIAVEHWLRICQIKLGTLTRDEFSTKMEHSGTSGVGN